MFSSTLPNPFLAWEGEAPAEPWFRKLGRSLALPFLPSLSHFSRNYFFRSKTHNATPSSGVRYCVYSWEVNDGLLA